MSNRMAVACLAIVLMIGAVMAGFLPVHANDVNCGSAFSAVDRADLVAEQYGDDLADAISGTNLRTAEYIADCDDRRATQRVLVIPLIVIGAAGGGFLLLTSGRKKESTGAAQEREK